jgi:hypothetical protein
MTNSRHHGKWAVQAREGNIRLKTNRIGLIKVDATAPIVGGEADWTSTQARLLLLVGISEVTTGNKLLDPEVHALINRGSDGVLSFDGEGTVTDDAVEFVGRAWAGNVEVPLTLSGTSDGEHDDERDVTLGGTATFHDIHLPIPGLTHVNSVDIHFEGLVKLIRTKG